MKSKKTYKKKTGPKRRRYGRKVYKRKPMFTLSSAMPFGQSQKVRHRYVDSVQLTTSSEPINGMYRYTFALNSAFDPNQSEAGHQPLGYDQMSAIFNQYTVIGARFNCKVIPMNDSDDSIGLLAYVTETPEPRTGRQIETLIEQGAGKYVICPPTGPSATTNVRIKNISGKISIKKQLKVNNLLDNENLRAVSNANPARLLYLHLIYWCATNGSLASVPMRVILTLDQLVVWQRPLNVEGS